MEHHSVRKNSETCFNICVVCCTFNISNYLNTYDQQLRKLISKWCIIWSVYKCNELKKVASSGMRTCYLEIFTDVKDLKTT